MTLVSEDAFYRLGFGKWGCLLETWLMWLWRVRMKVVYRWKLSIDENCQLKKVVCWWKLSFDEICLLMKVVYCWNLFINESCLLMKVVYWWKLSIDESCLLVKVVYWWKLSIDESWTSLRSDSLWRFACGDVSWWNPMYINVQLQKFTKSVQNCTLV